MSLNWTDKQAGDKIKSADINNIANATVENENSIKELESEVNTVKAKADLAFGIADSANSIANSANLSAQEANSKIEAVESDMNISFASQSWRIEDLEKDKMNFADVEGSDIDDGVNSTEKIEFFKQLDPTYAHAIFNSAAIFSYKPDGSDTAYIGNPPIQQTAISDDGRIYTRKLEPSVLDSSKYDGADKDWKPRTSVQCYTVKAGEKAYLEPGCLYYLGTQSAYKITLYNADGTRATAGDTGDEIGTTKIKLVCMVNELATGSSVSLDSYVNFTAGITALNTFSGANIFYTTPGGDNAYAMCNGGFISIWRIRI